MCMCMRMYERFVSIAAGSGSETEEEGASTRAQRMALLPKPVVTSLAVGSDGYVYLAVEPLVVPIAVEPTPPKQPTDYAKFKGGVVPSGGAAGGSSSNRCRGGEPNGGEP